MHTLNQLGLQQSTTPTLKNAPSLSFFVRVFPQTAEFEAFKSEASAKSKRARELVEERDREIAALTERLTAVDRRGTSGSGSGSGASSVGSGGKGGGDAFGLTEKSLLKYAQDQSRREAEVRVCLEILLLHTTRSNSSTLLLPYV